MKPRLFLLLRSLVLLAMVASPGVLFAQYTISSTSPASFLSNVSTNQSLTVSGTLPTSVGVGGYAYCFFTGYGASATPIIPGTATATSSAIVVPASTINSIPAGSFTAGAFLASLTIIPDPAGTTATCTGGSSTASNTFTIPIAYSSGGGTGGGTGSLSITSVAPSQLMQTNPATTLPEFPRSVLITGSGFLAPTTVSFAWSTGSANATIIYESATTLQVSLPTIPAGVTSTTVTVCNSGATCATSSPLTVSPLATTSGSISAAPNPSTVGVPTTVTATIAGTATLGAPSGTASVSVNGGASTPARLTLDPVTGAFGAGGSGSLASPLALGPFTGDVNGDGIPDLVYADPVGIIHLLLGSTPTGSFQTDTSLTNVTSSCYFENSLVLADFNGDGLADIAVNCFDTNNNLHVFVALSNGDGSFQNPIPLSNPTGTLLLTGDMNHDGKLDLVLVGTNASTNPQFSVYTGNGNGTFTASTVTTISSTSSDGSPIFYVTDIDGDGYPDLVDYKYFPNATTGSIDIYRNQNNTVYGVAGGASGNSPTYSVPLLASQYSYNGLLEGDVNGDGLTDFLVSYSQGTSSTTYGVTTFLNASKPGTILFTPGPYVPIPSPPIRLTVADFNGDGLADILFGVPCLTNCGVIAGGLNLRAMTGDGAGNFAANYPNLQVNAAAVGSFSVASLQSNAYADVLVQPLGETLQQITSYIPSGKAVVNLPFTPTTDGTNAIALSYAGDNFFTGTSLSLSLPVAGAPVTVNVGSSLLTSQYDQPVMLTATVTSAYVGSPAGAVNFYNNGVLLGQAPIVGGAATLTLSNLALGANAITASYVGNAVYAAGSSIGSVPIAVTQATPSITWVPTIATITYGTALSSAQLNAVASTRFATTIPGTYQYSSPVGQVLGVGSHTLQVTFTPTDKVDFATATGTVILQVTQATPTITWATPAPIVMGTPLSAAQLNATASGPLGSLPGQFTYTPTLGAILTPGAGQKLSVSFVPTDTTDYTNASASTTLTVIPLAITQITPTSIPLGSAATAISLTGTGFLPNAVVRINGTAVPTVYVSATQLSATVPSTLLQTVLALQITVTDPTQAQTSNALSAEIVAPTPAASFSGPSTAEPAQQPALSFTLTSGYPVPITATLALTFAGVDNVDDPSIQFASGGRTQTFTVPANSTITPTILIQSGTVSGTITVTLTLSAGGQDVTPTSITPVNITVPPAAPGITQATQISSGQTLTVSIVGFSNSREMSTATFHFIPASGASIATPDVTLPLTSLFTPWYGSATSQQYGSSFQYTQQFQFSSNVSSTISGVTVTLTNSTGTSATTTVQ